MVTPNISDGDLCYTERSLTSTVLPIRFCGHLSYDQNYTAMFSQNKNVTFSVTNVTVADLISQLSALSSDFIISADVTVVSSPPPQIHSMFLFYDEESTLDVAPLSKKRKSHRGKRLNAAQRAAIAAEKAEELMSLSHEIQNLCELSFIEALVCPYFPAHLYLDSHMTSKPCVVVNCDVPTPVVKKVFVPKPIVNPSPSSTFKDVLVHSPSVLPTPKPLSRPVTPVSKPVSQPRRALSTTPREVPPFRFGFYRFDDFFPRSRFQAGWCIRDFGIDWYMYEFAGKRWCISNKLRNRAAHATNGNGIREGQERASEAGNEIARDIESTIESHDRSNEIDVQAMKPQDENIPSERTYINGNTTKLAYRRVQLSKITLSAETAVDQDMLNIDPFLKYYNATLNHNSSMSTFRDVYFDLEFDIVVQALPAMAGIIHIVFDRFGGTGNETGVYSTDQLFAFPTQILDLSSKDSLNFAVTMELPYRVFNTNKTPFAGLGCGILKMFLATPMVVPAQMVMPATVTVFATAKNVRPFNLINRRSLQLQAALVVLDDTTEQSMTYRAPAQNTMRPVEIAREWGFVSRTAIPNESPVGHEITVIDLHPDESETPLSEVASAYSYYRGGIKVRLTVNLSKFQAITLAAVFVPADAVFEPNLYESYAFQEIVFDEKHEAVLNVRYATGSNWLPIFVAPGEHRRAEFGKLYIILRSQLVSTAPYGSTPTLLVEMAGADDFEVAHPRDYSKSYQQPPLLEMNPEVPRTFLTGSTNLYEDARIPVFYTRLRLSHTPWMIPVTCTYSNGGVLGLLKNTHAAWSGSIDYYFEFEGAGQAEIRYDPVKRIGNPSVLQVAGYMPSAGYYKFLNSRVNSNAHISVPFCSLYDYLPTRKSGMGATLNNANCNGALFIQGSGYVRVFRAAGKDFKVHFYNSIHKYNPEPTVRTITVATELTVRDSIVTPAISTIPYMHETGFTPVVDQTGRNTQNPPPTTPRSLEWEMGLGGISETMSAAKNLISKMEFDIPEAVETLRQAGTDVSEIVSDLYDTVPPVVEKCSATIDDVAALVPEVRAMIENGNKTFGDVSSVTDAICNLMSGPSKFAQSVLSASKGCISTIKEMILSIHGSISQIIQSITPKSILAIIGTISDIWSTADIAMVYAVATVCAAMAMGIANKWAIAGTLAVIGCAIPSMCDIMDKLFETITNPFSASAAKEGGLEMQAPSPIACGAALITSIITFFIPSKDWGIKGTGELGASIAKIFSGAKSIDEMLHEIYDMLVRMPMIEKLLGKSFGTVAILTQVDIEAYVSEVQGLMCTDYFNEALTTEKVRQQERLWKVHKVLQKHLMTLTKTNYFFNAIMKKVMDEQEKMYRHAMTFKGAGRERFPPYICMFAGETRVGKSTIVSEMMARVCDMMGWDKDTDIYTRQPSDPYFSGLGQQKILYVDDLHTNIVSNGAESDAALVMSFGTNAPWAPNMAALPDKGRNVHALLGMFCTNTPGEPSYAGIRNVPAYLARRHMLVLMRRKADVPTGYRPDHSQAEFVLLDPHDREGRRELDENMRPVPFGQGKVYDYPQIWKMFSDNFVNHLIEQRKSRDARSKAGINMQMPCQERLDVARELADHYDDVDYVDISKISSLQMQGVGPTYSQMCALAGKHRKYHDVLKNLTEKEVVGAIGDVVYMPESDNFLWQQINRANRNIFEKLVDVSAQSNPEEFKSSHWDTDRVRTEIRGYIDVLCEIEDEEEYAEFFSIIPVQWHDIIQAAVERRHELAEKAKDLTKLKNKNWREILRQLYESIPRWFKALLAAFTMGGAIFLGVAGLKKLFNLAVPAVSTVVRATPFVVATPEYANELAPSLTVPLRKTAHAIPVAEYAAELAPALTTKVKSARVIPRPEYAAELAPSLTVPVKKAAVVANVEYAAELAPSLTVPVKKAAVVADVEYAAELAPSLTVPVKKAHVVVTPEVALPELEIRMPPMDLAEIEDIGRFMISYEENPRAKREAEGSNVTMESQAQIQTAMKLYKYSRCGKIHQTRAGFTLHFMFLDNTTILCNRHFFTVQGGIQEGDEMVIFWRTPEGLMKYAFNYERKNAHAYPGTDIAVYVLPQAIMGIRSSWNLIATEAELRGVYPDIGVLITHDDEMDYFPQKLNRVVRRVAGETLNNYINLDGTADAVNGTTIYLDGFGYSSATAGGYCGSLLMLPNAGGKIFGIHSACVSNGKDAGNGVASYVSQEMLKSCLSNSEPMMPPLQPIEKLPAPVYEKRDNAVAAILTLQSGPWEPMIDVTPYGLPVVRVVSPLKATTGSMFTAYKASPLNRFFPNEPFRVPATLRPGDKRNPFEYDPRPAILGKYNKTIKPLPEKIVAAVVEHLTTQFSHLYHPYRPSELLTFEQAIDGVPNAPYFDAINFHTSPGLPYSQMGHHKKASLFVEDGMYSTGMPKRVCISELVATRYEAILNAARRGYMVDDVIFQEFMKDELLKRSKVFENPATRGIANPPLDLLLAERAAFLPFIALLQYNRHEIDCQVGINPMSGSEWTEMIHRLKSNSDLVFDADYTAFDSTIHPVVLDAFADIANGVMGGDFYTQLARKTLIRYVYDRVSQVTNVQVKIDQGMASGMPMTATGNSVINMIYLRAAWLMLAERYAPEMADLQKYDKNVKAIVYGDDNVVTVKAEVASWYNLRNIALVLEPYGILMTDGQKNARDKTKPFSCWEDIRFLKRAFVKDERTGMYMAPLERKTIIDRVRYVKSKAWWPDLEMRIQMSLEDCMFHGQEYFEAFKFFVNDCLKEMQLPCFTVSYERERSKWEIASCMLSIQAPNEVFYARDDQMGGVEVFYAAEDTAPTRLQNRWVLPLAGPRPAMGNESNTLGFWHAPRSTTPPPPPQSVRCLTLQGLQEELDRRNLVYQGNAIGGVTLEQLRNELAIVFPQFARNRVPGLVTTEEVGVMLENLYLRLIGYVSQNQPTPIPIPPTPPPISQPIPIPPPVLQKRRTFVAGRRGLVDSWNNGSLCEAFYYVGAPGVIVVDGERFHVSQFAGFFEDDGTMTVQIVGRNDEEILENIREVSISSGIAGFVQVHNLGWGSQFGSSWNRRKFDVKIPLGGDSEIGNFRYKSGNLESQVLERIGEYPGRWTEHKIAGRKFYQMHRGNHNDMCWPWVIIHWNCVQILELLGARNVPKFASSHGRYEWDHMSEYTVNIADALFGRRRSSILSLRE